MPVIKTQSLRDLLYLQDRMNKLFDESMKTVTPPTGLSEWIPYVDIFEDDSGITIKAEVPGLSREEILVDISATSLSISGKKLRSLDERIESYHNIERQYGSFKRNFGLPSGVDREKIAAKLENGVLEISIPKEKKDYTRKINISPYCICI